MKLNWLVARTVLGTILASGGVAYGVSSCVATPPAPPELPEAMSVVHCTAGLPDTPNVNSTPDAHWRKAENSPTFWSDTRMFHVPEGYTCEVIAEP